MRNTLIKPLCTSANTPCPDRRRFLRNSLVIAGGLVAAPALATVRRTGERRIELLNLHTGEKERVLYWSQGEYQAGGLDDLNHLLRDHRTGDVYQMDPALYDLVHDLGWQLDGNPRIEVISGYRSPKTNSTLRNKSKGVARRSLHMQGKAIDLRMPDVPLSTLRKTALNMQRGGVGFYPKPGFVHLDTGRVRSW
ncbi:MAG: DUF882 domain-containing protein [Candidatus Sedimenticola sp. 20ELBAFRAG]